MDPNWLKLISELEKSKIFNLENIRNIDTVPIEIFKCRVNFQKVKREQKN